MTRHIIKAAFKCPPAPYEDYWVIWSDSLGEDASPYGQGDTEQEAVDDLREQLAEIDA